MCHSHPAGAVSGRPLKLIPGTVPNGLDSRVKPKLRPTVHDISIKKKQKSQFCQTGEWWPQNGSKDMGEKIVINSKGVKQQSTEVEIWASRCSRSGFSESYGRPRSRAAFCWAKTHCGLIQTLRKSSPDKFRGQMWLFTQMLRGDREGLKCTVMCTPEEAQVIISPVSLKVGVFIVKRIRSYVCLHWWTKKKKVEKTRDHLEIRP